MEFLLLALLASLWFLLRPKRDWYVVEWRRCDSEPLASTAFESPADAGFHKGALKAHGFSIESKVPHTAVLLHKHGGRIRIGQESFESMDAAILHLKRSSDLIAFSEGSHKLYLWRTVARSRRKSYVLPPTSYWDREATLLDSRPKELWFKPRRAASEPTIGT